MFEDSMMESAGKVPSNPRWMLAGSMLLQAIAVASLLVIPILYPEALPRQTTADLLAAPPESRPPAARSRLHTPTTAPPTQPRAIVLEINTQPSRLSHLAALTSGEPGPPTTDLDTSVDAQMGTPGGMPELAPMAPAPVARAVHKGPVRISSGVAAGQLLEPIRAFYPPIAQAAHVQGTVTVAATISRQGTIENLRVITGPPLLQDAAIRAVRSAHYRPFLLNGEPVEVETTINVVFTMGG